MAVLGGIILRVGGDFVFHGKRESRIAQTCGTRSGTGKSTNYRMVGLTDEIAEIVDAKPRARQPAEEV